MKTNNKLIKKLLNARINKKILLTSKYYYSAFINASDRLDALYIFDAHSHKILEANEVFWEMLQYSPADLQSLYIENIIVADSAEINLNINNVLQHRVVDLGLRQYKRKDSSMLFVESKIKLFKSKKRYYIIVAIRDITDWQHIQNRLKLALQVFNTAIDGIVVTDAQGVIQLANPAYLENTGYSLEELLGMTPRILKSGRHDDSFYEDMWSSLFENGNWQGEIWNKRKNGELFPLWLMINAIKDDCGQVIMYSAVARDLSERLKYEEKIKYQAYYDGLTDLPNRRFFYQKAHDYINLAKRYNYMMSIMFIDLDGFKSVNDNLGHNIGDLLLIEVGNRLKKCVRESDTVARMGGDEFTLILAKINTMHDAEIVARKIQDLIGQPFTINNHSIYISCSIGISIFPDHSDNEEILIKKADNAMYQAKTQGKNAYKFYTEDVQTEKIYKPLS